MREVLKSDGSKAITMNSEPKQSKRPGPEPITTRNTPVKTRADREAAKIEAEKGAKNEKA